MSLPLPLPLPQVRHKFGHVALYVLPAEAALGAVTLLAHRLTASRSARHKVAGAALAALVYTGACQLALLAATSIRRIRAHRAWSFPGIASCLQGHVRPLPSSCVAQAHSHSRSSSSNGCYRPSGGSTLRGSFGIGSFGLGAVTAVSQ